MPPGYWGRTWLVAVLMAAASIAGLEWFWRAQGHQPAVEDHKDLWSWQRRQAADGKHDTVTLLGASRMMLGFSTETFRKRFPTRRLTASASSPAEPPARALAGIW